MKKDYTILVPSMLPIHFRLLTPVFAKSGYKLEVLTNEGEQVREEGLAHVHNDTCYPALLVIGQMIELSFFIEKSFGYGRMATHSLFICQCEWSRKRQ